MGEKRFNLLKFIYNIIRFIVLLPIYAVKYFFVGFYFINTTIINILLFAIIFTSFILYKIIKYIILFFAFPVLIYNILKVKGNAKLLKKKLEKENEIITIPYNEEFNSYNVPEIINIDKIENEKVLEDTIIVSEQENIDLSELDNHSEIEFNNETVLSTNMNNVNEEIEETKIVVKTPRPNYLKIFFKKIFRYMENGLLAIAFSIYKIFKWFVLGWAYILFNILRLFMVVSFPVYKIFKYFALGLAYTFFVIKQIFVYLSFITYKMVKYLALSFSLPIIMLNVLGRVAERNSIKREQLRLKREEKKFKKQLEIQKKQEEKLRVAMEKKKNKARQKDEYVNEDLKIEKKTIGQKINNVLDKIFSAPGIAVKKIKSAYENSVFVKNYKNKKDINRQALLIDFDGDDAEKSDVKLVYQYTAKSADGKIVTDYFEAYSKVEVHSFLLSEGYEVYNIKTNKWIQTLHGTKSVSKEKIKTKDLIFFLNQLSTYLKAGITLVEALKILCRQYEKQKKYQKIFRTIIYDLSTGESFSSALSKQGDAFPKILINMIRASEMTGELPEALDDMTDYFTEIDKTKKQMVTALTYPIIILVVAVAVVIFILLFVIPKFVSIYETMDASKIPKFTLVILAISDFLKYNYIYLIIGVIVVVLVGVYLYKNVKAFRTIMQWLVMHMPVFGNVVIYNEVTIFTKTFSSLLSHNVFITDSMEILNKVTNNEIYKMLILDTITNLAKGEKISESFKDHWAFPVPAYEMLVTGERTGQLPEMMAKVSQYYQELHRNSVTRIKTFIEPILILFLTGIVGAIVLAIVIPMFGMYESVQGFGK